MSRLIVLATGNAGKLREIHQVLAAVDVQLAALGDFPDIPEPHETSETFAGNARDKARYYSLATGQWCLADDSGLVVDALSGRPGVFSARYAGEDCPTSASREQLDLANNAKLLKELAGVPESQRTARFICRLALADGNDILLETEGSIEGRIIHAAQGENGFGYDPLFYVRELGFTTAELSPEEKNRISHRGKAVRQFAEKLKALL